MKAFKDGNAVCITFDNFVNLQESPAVFVTGELAAEIEKAYLDNLLPEKFKADFDGENHTHRFTAYAQEVASLMLEAAGVAEMAARIAALEAELAKHQESQFHPDWSQLKTTRESLREAWARIRELEAELVRVREVLHEQTSYLEGRLRNAMTGEGCPHGCVRPSQCVDCIKERG